MDIDEPSVKSSPTQKWKQDMIEAQGWTLINDKPDKIRKSLHKNLSTIQSKASPSDVARFTLDKGLTTHLSGVKREGAAKFIGDKEYKMYMETVEQHLKLAWQCVNLGQPLSQEALQGLQSARGSLNHALEHYTKAEEEKGDTLTGRREKKIEELKLCLGSLDDFELTNQNRNTILQQTQQECEQKEAKALTAKGAPVDQVNTLLVSMYDCGKDLKKRPPSDNAEARKKFLKAQGQAKEDVTEGSTVIVEALAGGNEFIQAVFLSNLPGCNVGTKEEVEEKQAAHLAMLVGNAKPSATKKFFASIPVPPKQLDAILGNFTGDDAVPLVEEDSSVVREQVARAWAEGTASAKGPVKQVCQALLNDCYVGKGSGSGGKRPLRGPESAAIVLKGVALAGDGEAMITSALKSTLKACTAKLEVDPEKNPKAEKDIEAVKQIVRQLMAAALQMKLPEGLCISSAQIYLTYVDEYGPDEALALVGGHVILRIIAPMITKAGSSAAVYVSKILQTLANGTTFKDARMQSFNPLLEELDANIKAFLVRIVKAAESPELREGT
jgi:hypothetical protein